MWELFIVFAKMGAFTFGGGYAMLPLLQREIVDRKKWATEEDLMDYYAIGQSTPGIIAVNTAVFIGYKQKEIPGAIAAILGLITPSILIIIGIASLLKGIRNNESIDHIFQGIRIAVCALVMMTVYRMAKTGIRDILGFLIFLLTTIAIALWKITPIIPVVLSAIIYIVYQFRKDDHHGKYDR
ncbi:MAG: chromate transporter [Tissierellia bacterium]|nr:chromate transporter [Tissierellia bacterium]